MSIETLIKSEPNLNRKIILYQNPNNPQSRTAQRERILAPGRLLINRPEPGQLVDLLGQSHSNRHRRSRHIIGRPQRRVVIFRRIRHGVRQPGLARIVAAHQALQFGELIDHLGAEIGLGHPRGLLGLICISLDQRGQLTRQGRHTVDQLGLGAQLVVEGDVFQRLHPSLHARA